MRDLKELVKEAEKEAERQNKERAEAMNSEVERKPGKKTNVMPGNIIGKNRKMEPKFNVRIVVETKYGENYWRSRILTELDLTLEQRERLIATLAWIGKDY